MLCYLAVRPKASHQLNPALYLCVCVLCVSPTPRVTWSRLDTAMPAKNTNASFGQELVINDAEFSDSGRYQCTAVNTASARPNDIVDFTLTVECTYSVSAGPNSITSICCGFVAVLQLPSVL